MNTTRTARIRPRRLSVRGLGASRTRGTLVFGNYTVPCAIGRGALRVLKREGDGATPCGVFRVLRVLYRADRVPRPHTALPVRRIEPRDGWCDSPVDRNYNRPVQRPYPASSETLYRSDAVYDIVVVLDYNIMPRRRFAGSAIFFHLARPDFRPTEGCIAVSGPHMRRLLAVCRPADTFVIGMHVGSALVGRRNDIR